MLFQLGDEGSRPTFFEMDAADKLQHGLKAALLYSLGVTCDVLCATQSGKRPRLGSLHISRVNRSWIKYIQFNVIVLVLQNLDERTRAGKVG